MSFQAYLTNIEATTGKSPADFRKLATDKGLLAAGAVAPGVTATRIVAWLKEDFDLGHGHAMALYALFKGIKQEGDA